MIKIQLSVPYWVVLPRIRREDVKVILNFNQYHNWNKFKRNEIKQRFTEMMEDTLAGCPKLSHVTEIQYTLYAGDAAHRDTNNYIVLVDKYFCDSLVHWGVLPDDNHDYIDRTISAWGGIDRNNPRVEITIYGILD